MKAIFIHFTTAENAVIKKMGGSGKKQVKKKAAEPID
jgi:hypothetical protein